eukprot:165223-Rhodomonas_salina.1
MTCTRVCGGRAHGGAADVHTRGQVSRLQQQQSSSALAPPPPTGPLLSLLARYYHVSSGTDMADWYWNAVPRSGTEMEKCRRGEGAGEGEGGEGEGAGLLASDGGALR